MRGATVFKAMLAAAAVFGAFTVASAQDYPNKPIRFIIPNGAGGLTDIIARMNAEDLSNELGQRIIPDNRPSASNVLAAELCAKAPPDGYTMCSVNNNMMTLNPALYDKLPYNPATQFKPVILMYIVRDALVTSNDFPAKTVAELKAYAVEKKGPVNFATLGPGSVPDLFISWLNKQWGTSMRPIAYKSGAAVSVALMSNEVQVTRFGLGNYASLIEEKRIRFIAGGKERYKSFPDVPSGIEAGVGGFPFQSFIGIAVPAATPDAVVDRLQAAFLKIVQQPKYAEFLEKHGLGLVASTRKEFEEFLTRERQAAKELVTPIKAPAK